MTVIVLHPNGAFSAKHSLATLSAHAIPGAELHDGKSGRHARLFWLRDEYHRIDVVIEDGHVTATMQSTDLRLVFSASVALRRWLDLDTDASTVVAAFEEDPILGPLVRARPGLRLVTYPDLFEATIMTIAGQQVSVAAGRTFGGRLVDAFGSEHRDGLTIFPEPAQLASVSELELRAAVGITGARARTVIAAAVAFRDNPVFTRSFASDQTEIRKALLGVTGIGPWTADYLEIRALHDRDAFAAADLVLRRALGGISVQQAAQLAQRWRPLRAYAMAHLWASTLSMEPLAGTHIRPRPRCLAVWGDASACVICPSLCGDRLQEP